MKIFITKLSIFSAILILYLGFNIILNINNYEIELSKSNIHIIGDSHTEMSLNPKLFFSAQNISQPAEPYCLTFWKLKKIIKSNKPDTIILGFAPHNISAYNDLKFSNKKWSVTMFRRSYTIENLKSIDSEIEVDYFMYYKTVLKQIGLYPKRNHNNYIGHYLSSFDNNILDWELPIKRHYFQNGNELGVSYVSVSHLDSIVNLCDIKNITLILVSAPVHEDYLNNIPNTILEKYNLLKHKYEHQLLIIDRMINTYPDSFFFNPDHLNVHGANKFSGEVIDFLKKI